MDFLVSLSSNSLRECCCIGDFCYQWKPMNCTVYVGISSKKTNESINKNINSFVLCDFTWAKLVEKTNKRYFSNKTGFMWYIITISYHWLLLSLDSYYCTYCFMYRKREKYFSDQVGPIFTETLAIDPSTAFSLRSKTLELSGTYSKTSGNDPKIPSNLNPLQGRVSHW